MVYLVLVLGLLFGSFYNVCIYRLPIGKSVIVPRSSCGSCGHTLSGLDLIPVMSWVFSKGKCRHCGVKFSGRYALVELLTGLLFVLVYMRFGFTYNTLVGLVLSSIAIVVTFIDFDHHIILDRFSIITMLLAVVYHVYLSDMSLMNIGLGFIVGGAIFYLIALLGTMGGGDIKIMASFGLLLGFPYIIMATYLAFVIGAIVFIPVLVYHKIKQTRYNSQVAFGPFLCLGTWITFLYGSSLFDFYMTVIV